MVGHDGHLFLRVRLNLPTEGVSGMAVVVVAFQRMAPEAAVVLRERSSLPETTWLAHPLRRHHERGDRAGIYVISGTIQLSFLGDAIGLAQSLSEHGSPYHGMVGI